MFLDRALAGRRKRRTLTIADQVVILINEADSRSRYPGYAVAAKRGDLPDLDSKAIDLGQLVHMLIAWRRGSIRHQHLS